MKKDKTNSEKNGKMLIDLIKAHKYRCNDPECGISTYMYLSVFEDLVDRKATTEEVKKFL